MSEAVRSGWRGSLGAIAMRLREVPEMNVAVVDQQFATRFERKTECVTQFLRIRVMAYIHSDSRTSCKEYKLSNCIDRA